MAGPSDATLNRWIEQSWDNPPNWTRSAFKEMFVEEQRHLAEQRAQSLEAKRIAALEAENRRLAARLARLEKTLGPGGKTLAKQFSGAIAEALPQVIDRHLEARKTLRDGGVWSESRAYAQGSVVTFKGAAWVAEERAEPGQKPGIGRPWRLQVKSDEVQLRKMLRDELKKEPVVR